MKSPAQYQRLYNQGEKFKTPYFIGYFLVKEGENNTYGLVASRRIGPAVKRNRARRLLREACRLWEKGLSQTAPRYDLVLIARPEINKKNFHEIFNQLEKSLRQSL